LLQRANVFSGIIAVPFPSSKTRVILAVSLALFTVSYWLFSGITDISLFFSASPSSSALLAESQAALLLLPKWPLYPHGRHLTVLS
jgi:hypothetical protein